MKKVVICRKKSQYWQKKLCFVEKNCNNGKKMHFVEKICNIRKKSCVL